MHISSWTLVCISAERFIKVKFPLKFIAGNISKKLVSSYIIICLLFVLLDSHFFWTNSLVISDNSKHCNNTSENYFEFEEQYFSIVDMLVFFMVSKLNFATALLYLLQYTNYSVNFFIYIITNRQFRKWIPFNSLLSLVRSW
ncbi:uncharacterized protein LOC127715770 [Mytilus californianus]|uniref:uncharacterized protein LOC127715770 n=1 Tax=Mytilus californianus TaxID=6549 RepID=UPI002248727B|nr:uncharacterized protein LOC127715770 [Mytilus californianus]